MHQVTAAMSCSPFRVCTSAPMHTPRHPEGRRAGQAIRVHMQQERPLRRYRIAPCRSVVRPSRPCPQHPRHELRTPCCPAVLGFDRHTGSVADAPVPSHTPQPQLPRSALSRRMLQAGHTVLPTPATTPSAGSCPAACRWRTQRQPHSHRGHLPLRCAHRFAAATSILHSLLHGAQKEHIAVVRPSRPC